jgi:hypothetical protein
MQTEIVLNGCRSLKTKKKCLLTLLGSHVIGIEHMGNPAILQQRAKPIIALFVGVFRPSMNYHDKKCGNIMCFYRFLFSLFVRFYLDIPDMCGDTVSQ